MKILLQQDSPIDNVTALKGWEHNALIIPQHLRDKHKIQPDEVFLIFQGDVAERIPLQKVLKRKEGLKKIDSLFRTDSLMASVRKGLYTFEAYLEREDGSETGNAILYGVFNDIRKAVCTYCFKHDSLAVMIPHFHQEGQLPHVHFLYVRSDEEKDALQNYLTDILKIDKE